MSEDFSQTGSNPDRTAEFLRLYTLHQPRLFAYVLTMIPKWHDAEEVLQETSVVLWQAFGQFQLGTDFRAWANKTALNQVLSFRKRHKRLAVPLSERFVEAIAGNATSRPTPWTKNWRRWSNASISSRPTNANSLPNAMSPTSPSRKWRSGSAGRRAPSTSRSRGFVAS